jgi:hypothetical protein
MQSSDDAEATKAKSTIDVLQLREGDYTGVGYVTLKPPTTISFCSVRDTFAFVHLALCRGPGEGPPVHDGPHRNTAEGALEARG